MKRYKEPHFQERIAAAASARTEVLERLRTKVPVVPTVTPDQAERRLAKEAGARKAPGGPARGERAKGCQTCADQRNGRGEGGQAKARTQ